MEVPVTPFLTRDQLADRWHMSARTLENWAVAKRGPKPRRFGRRVLYLVSDVVAFETSEAVAS